MSDQEKLNKARVHFDRGEYPDARKLLEEVTTQDPTIRINVLSVFISVLDHVTENDKLLAVATEGVDVATKAGNETMRSYFLGKKCFFLLSDLSMLLYRQKNLTLSAQVFDWIDFSLERDKREYEEKEKRRKELEMEINLTLNTVIEEVESSSVHNFKGHQFSTIGDAYSSKYLVYKLDHQKGGKLKSKIANMYFVRRWNLDRYLYDRKVRARIDESRDKCIQYFERSIKEFEQAGMKSEQAHTIYNLAAKLKLFNRFRRSQKLLNEAKNMAESINEKRLLEKISYLKKDVEDKNKHLRDYVSEFGLDMP